MNAIFATLFNSANPEEARYYNLGWTFIRLFHYMVAQYEYQYLMHNYQTSYMVMYMLHTVISNVFMVNFIAATI